MKKPLIKKPWVAWGWGTAGAGHGWWRYACVDVLGVHLAIGSGSRPGRREVTDGPDVPLTPMRLSELTRKPWLRMELTGALSKSNDLMPGDAKGGGGDEADGEPRLPAVDPAASAPRRKGSPRASGSPGPSPALSIRREVDAAGAGISATVAGSPRPSPTSSSTC